MLKGFFKKNTANSILKKDIQKYIYNRSNIPLDTVLNNKKENNEYGENKGIKEYFNKRKKINEEKANIILEKANYKELENKYEKLNNQYEKLKKTTERYYEEKKYFENKLLGNKHGFFPKIFNYKLMEYIKVLNSYGFISIFLIINLILLIYISKNIKESQVNFDINKEYKIAVKANEVEKNKIKQAVLPYTVLVGVYKDFEQAKQNANILRNKNFKASINKPLNSKSNFYRVYVGHFKTVKDAELILEDVRKNTDFINSYIKKNI